MMGNATHNIEQVHQDFASVGAQPDKNNRVRLVGRMVGIESLGRISHILLQDEKNSIQVNVFHQHVGAEAYNACMDCEIGSTIRVEGAVYRNLDHDVILIRASEFEVLEHFERPDHIIYTRSEVRPRQPTEVVHQKDGTFRYITDDGVEWIRDIPTGNSTLWQQDIVLDVQTVSMRPKSSPRLAEDELSNRGPGEESTCATQ